MEDLLSKLNKEKIAQYQAHLEKLDLSEATIKRRLSSLRRFYNWAEKEGYLEKPPRKAPVIKEIPLIKRFKYLASKLRPSLPSMPTIPFISDAYEVYQSISITRYLHYAILIIFCVGLGMGIYNQLTGPKAELAGAYPTSLISPNRYLSFQGRLTDSSNNPITGSTDFVFKLYNAEGTGCPPSGGVQLWSGSCSIDPDEDGIFSVLLGKDCGSEIDESVFSENPDVWLEITVGTDPYDEILCPRIQIATVGYALNAETLQGYPPGTGINRIPYIDNTGKITIAAASPTIESSSGTFAITGQALSITTATGSDGNIVLAPDGVGTLNINVGGTGPGGQVQITDANIVSGSLLSVYAGTSATGFDLLNLSSGTGTPGTTVFSVDESGNTYIAGTVGIGTTNPGATLDVNGDVKIGTVNNVSDNSQVLTVDSGVVKYIDTSNWDKTASDDVAGSGTTSYIPKWQNSNTLTNSIIYETASKIGIGTTNPGYKLDVAGNVNIGGTGTIGNIPLVSDNNRVLTSSGAGSGDIQYIDTTNWDKSTADDYVSWLLTGDSGTPQTIGTGNTASFVGGIGIGTTASATDTLTINVDESYGFAWTGAQSWSNTATFNGTLDANGVVTLGDNGENVTIDSNVWDISGAGVGSGFTQFTIDNIDLNDNTIAATDNGGLYLYDNASNGIYIEDGGYVGIGTTDPSQLLHVAGAMRLENALYDLNNQAGTSGQILSTTGSGVYWVDIGTIGVGGTGTTGHVPKWISSSTLGDSVIYDDGTNVGIGTTNPTYKLDVSGTGRFTDNIDAENGLDVTNASLTVAGSYSWNTSGQIAAATSGTINSLNINAGALSGVTGYTQASGAFAFSGGGNFSVDSAAFDITTGGAVSGVTTLSMSNQLTNSYANTAAINLTGAGAGITFGSSGPYQIITSGSTDLALMPGGNVGIGTTAPNYTLAVKGTFGVTGTQGIMALDATGSDLTFSRAGGNYIRATNASGTIGLGAKGSYTTLQIEGGANSSLLIKSDATANSLVLTGGYVGIGTTAPEQELTVDGDIQLGMSDGTRYLYFHDGGSPYAGIRYDSSTDKMQFSHDGSSWSDMGTGGGGYWTLSGSDLYPNLPSYNVGIGTTGSAGTAKLYVNGNVGIGTTGPASPLHIANSNYVPLRIERTGATNPNEWMFQVTGGSGFTAGSLVLQAVDVDADFGIRDNSSNTRLLMDLSAGDLGIGGTITDSGFSGASMVIKSGNVGIGTTNPSYLLDVSGNVNIGGTGTIGNIPLVSDNNRVLTSASAGSGDIQYIDTTNWDKDSSDDYGAWWLSGDSGTPQNIGAGDTVSIAGGIGIGTTASATDTLTINVDESYGFAWTGAQSWAGSADFNSDVSIDDASIALDNATATNLAVTGDFSINTNDFFIKKSNGNIGIGTTAPDAITEISGYASYGASHTGTALLHLTATGFENTITDLFKVTSSNGNLYFLAGGMFEVTGSNSEVKATAFTASNIKRFVGITDSGWSQYDVVVYTPGTARYDTTTTANNNMVAGVAASNLAPGSSGDVIYLGHYVTVNVTGTVNAGDTLVTSTTAGRAMANNSAPRGASLGKAMTSFAGPGNGTVSAIIDPGDTGFGGGQVNNDTFFMGNVGIGTTNPGSLLDVAGTSEFNGTAAFLNTGGGQELFRTVWDGGNTGGIAAPNGRGLYLTTSGTASTQGIFIDGAGKVGIGTVGPTQKFEVDGNMEMSGDTGIFYLSRSNTDYGHIGSGNQVVTGSAATDLGLNAVNNMVFGISNVEKMRISSSGNVGIGTTSPNEELAVAGDVDLTGHLAVGADGAISTTTLLDIDETFTDGSASNYGVWIEPTFNFTAGANTTQTGLLVMPYFDDVVEGSYNVDLRGLYVYASVGDGSTADDIYGSYVTAEANISSGTIASMYGAVNRIHNYSNYGGGTVTNAYGNYIWIENDKTMGTAYGVLSEIYNDGTMTTAYGVKSTMYGSSYTTGYAYYADCDDASTCYGLYVAAGDPQVTTDWGLYVTGEDKNYFSGNVGIGTTNPGSYKLNVAGTAAFNNAGVTIDSNSYVNAQRFVDIGSNYYLDPAATTTSGLFAGNVGIGTTAPSHSLTVQTTAAGGSVFKAITNYSTFTIDNLTTVYETTATTGSHQFTIIDKDNANNRAALVIKGDGGNKEILYVASGGNVGIGTTSPAYRLHVTGDISTSTANARGGEFNPIFTGSGDGPGGFESKPKFQPSASLNAAYGLINIAEANPGTGINIADLRGGYYRVDSTSGAAGSISNAYAMYASEPVFNGPKPTSNYGVYIRNQGVSGITTAYGLYVAAQSGASTNYAAAFTGGNVGIGTASPQSALQVNGTISLNDTNTQIWEDGSSNLSFKDAVAGTKTLNELVTATSFGQLKHLAVQVTGDGTQYKDYTWTHGMGVTPSAVIATIDMTAVGDSWIVNTYNPGTTTVSFRIYRRDGGNWSNTLNLRALGIWPASGADLAEYFPTNEDPESLEPGTLISMNPDNPTYIKKSDKVYDELLLGIVPTDPGMVIGEETEGNRQLIALSGRVPALVTLEEGKILPGDFITSSSIPGYGMKINSYRGGPAVGIALEGFDPAIDSSKVIPCPSGFEHQTCGKIMVFVNRTTHDPQIYLTDAGDLEIAGSQASAGADSQKFELKDKEGNLITRIGAFSEAVIAELRAGLIKSQEIVTEKLASKEVQTEKLISPLVETKKIQTERISLKDIEAKPGEDIVIDLASSEQRLASSSGFGKLVVKGKDNKEVVSIDAQGNATFAGELRAKKIVAEEIVGLEGKFGELLAATVSAQKIEGLEERLVQLEAVKASPSPIPSSTPSPEPELLATESGNPMDDVELSPDIEALVNEILGTSLEATPQAELTYIDGEDINIVNNLTVLGIASFADTSIAGSLNVSGTMNLSDNSINTLTGTLYLQNLDLGGIDILAGKITIDEQGNAVFEGDVTIKGRLALSEIEPLPGEDIVVNLVNQDNEVSQESKFGKLLVKGTNDEVVASIEASGTATFKKLAIAKAEEEISQVSETEIETNATAGQAILPAGETEITIKSQFVTDKTMVYVTPISSTQNKVLFVEAKKAATEQELGWFKVKIDTSITQDIEFNWWLIN